MSTIAEETTPSSSSPPPSVPGGGVPRPDEPDLLAERRARRANEPAEQVLLRRAEAAEATVRTLEAHVFSLRQRLTEAEGDRLRTTELAERLERVEGALETIRESHRRMAQTVGELKDVTIHLRALAERPSAPVVPVVPLSAASSPALSAPQREEMADALAAAVERLRARAQQAPTPAPARKPHKHSMSLIGRLRYARKQRREAR
jgi:hypothetical protein